MAPLYHAFNIFLIAFKYSFYISALRILDPARQFVKIRHFPCIGAEKYALDKT
jgi:hypothetical protein